MSGDTIVVNALSFEGLSWGTDSERFSRLILPADNDHDREELASHVYSCALVARAVLSHAGVDGRCEHRGAEHDVLREAYNPLRVSGLDAVSLLEALARHHGVWNARPKLDDIQPGWVVTVGGSDALGGTAHVMTVTSRIGNVIECIEGGQTDPMNLGRGSAIKRKTHALEVRAGRVWVVGGRGVYGAFDGGACPAGPVVCDDNSICMAA